MYYLLYKFYSAVSKIMGNEFKVLFCFLKFRSFFFLLVQTISLGIEFFFYLRSFVVYYEKICIYTFDYMFKFN